MRTTLYAVLCLVIVVALWLFYARGYGILVYVLSLPVTTVLWCLRKDPTEGLELIWRQGVWTLERDGVQRVVALGKRSISTPWVIYLAVTDLSVDRGCHLWLYADSSPGQQLRCLRARLTLEK
jgi:hypothetical protein